jgi:CO dehydrogenase/acetyl-CoA synthase gamma subunit (corrinoid Fe-S protein)
MIVTLDSTTVDEKQKRFGFTFWWQSQYNYTQKNDDDDAKFALAPDSLVKEALMTWIKSQNQQAKVGGGELLVRKKVVYFNIFSKNLKF